MNLPGRSGRHVASGKTWVNADGIWDRRREQAGQPSEAASGYAMLAGIPVPANVQRYTSWAKGLMSPRLHHHLLRVFLCRPGTQQTRTSSLLRLDLSTMEACKATEASAPVMAISCFRLLSFLVRSFRCRHRQMSLTISPTFSLLQLLLQRPLRHDGER